MLHLADIYSTREGVRLQSNKMCFYALKNSKTFSRKRETRDGTEPRALLARDHVLTCHRGGKHARIGRRSVAGGAEELDTGAT